MTARRGHNEGTLYERPNGKWQAQVSLADGTRKTFTANTKREVQVLLNAARSDVTSGRLTTNEKQSVKEYLVWWLTTIQPSVRYSTHRSYELNVERVSRHLGKVRLDALRPVQIQEAYSKLLAEGLSPRSVQMTHTVFHTALRHAEKLGLIARNPCDAAIPPKAPRHEGRTLSPEEAQRLFDASENPTLRSLFVVMCTTGVRVGEALGLKWDDVDLDAGTISIRRAIQRQRGDGLVFVEPKTALSRRTIQLATMARDTLRDLRNLQATVADRPHWQNTNVVFASETGTPLDPGNVSHRFQVIRERAGLPHLRLHDLRHTAATWLLQQGVHPSVVREILGHSTITLTLGTYSHVAPTMHRDAARSLDALLSDVGRDLD